jgi:hypothetical protein
MAVAPPITEITSEVITPVEEIPVVVPEVVEETPETMAVATVNRSEGTVKTGIVSGIGAVLGSLIGL